ncbi:MAG: lamin tail domain-containing protein, partial [Ardenticatenaceae bacterium]
ILLRSADGLTYEVVGYETYTAKPPAPVYSAADVRLNEILPVPRNNKPEWVEFYNLTSQAIDIGGTWIDDIANGGSAPQQIPAGTTIPAGGFYGWETSSYFNNSGDDVRYLATDGVTIYDAFSYGSTGTNRSWYRLPDGGSWAATTDSSPTKGASNN